MNWSIENSSKRELPRYGCNLAMNMWVTNTHENPKIKFWRCRNFEVRIKLL